MKIERGILKFDPLEDVMVITPGHIYKLNVSSMTERDYFNEEKVYGVIINGGFTLCHDFILNTGQTHFGYILSNGFGSTAIRVQLITDFDPLNHRSFNLNKEYLAGPEIVLKKEAITNFI